VGNLGEQALVSQFYVLAGLNDRRRGDVLQKQSWPNLAEV